MEYLQHIFLFSLLILKPIKGTFLDSILEPVNCALVLSKSFRQEYGVSLVPTIQIDVGSSDNVMLEQSSKICLAYVIIVDDIEDFQSVIESVGPGLKQGSKHRYILVFGKDVLLDDVEGVLLKRDGFFSKVLNLVLVINDMSYPGRRLVLEKDVSDESKFVWMNQWNGTSLANQAAMSTRQKTIDNFKGKQLTVTSFPYAPFYYIKPDGSRGGAEVLFQPLHFVEC